jgi:hypothetical protein
MGIRSEFLHNSKQNENFQFLTRIYFISNRNAGRS